jgi:hypothetical protein
MFGMSSAHATPVKIKFDSFTASSAKTVKVDYSDPSGPKTVSAGMFNLSVAPGSDSSWLDMANSPIFAFCVELTQNISIGSTYDFNLEKAEDVLNPNSVASINRLLSSLSDFSFTSDQSAVLQASIWELVYDQVLPGDLNSGNFEVVTSGGNVSAVTDFNQYLNAANSYTGELKYELFVLQSAGNQDQLVWRAVSAPSAFALFLVMAGLVFVRARKA